MGAKVCRVKGIDQRGLPKTVLVEACSLFEAAAEGFERLQREGGCRFDELEVTVHEPRGTFPVRPGPFVKWLSHRTDGESIGVTALKRRVQEMLRTSQSVRAVARTRKERRQG